MSEMYNLGVALREIVKSALATDTWRPAEQVFGHLHINTGLYFMCSNGRVLYQTIDRTAILPERSPSVFQTPIFGGRKLINV